jgi:hypothetical protein
MSTAFDVDIIASNPIEDGLVEFRRVLKAGYEGMGIHEFPGSQESVMRFEASSGTNFLHTVITNQLTQHRGEGFGNQAIIVFAKSTCSGKTTVENRSRKPARRSTPVRIRGSL